MELWQTLTPLNAKYACMQHLPAVATVRVLVSLRACVQLHSTSPSFCLGVGLFDLAMGRSAATRIVEAIYLLGVKCFRQLWRGGWLRRRKNNVHDVVGDQVSMWKSLSSRLRVRYDQVVWFEPSQQWPRTGVWRCRSMPVSVWFPHRHHDFSVSLSLLFRNSSNDSVDRHIYISFKKGVDRHIWRSITIWSIIFFPWRLNEQLF